MRVIHISLLVLIWLFSSQAMAADELPQTQIAKPADIRGVVAVLEGKYGWSEKDIRGFLGENLIRVYRANWK